MMSKKLLLTLLIRDHFLIKWSQVISLPHKKNRVDPRNSQGIRSRTPCEFWKTTKQQQGSWRSCPHHQHCAPPLAQHWRCHCRTKPGRRRRGQQSEQNRKSLSLRSLNHNFVGVLLYCIFLGNVKNNQMYWETGATPSCKDKLNIHGYLFSKTAYKEENTVIYEMINDVAKTDRELSHFHNTRMQGHPVKQHGNI